MALLSELDALGANTREALSRVMDDEDLYVMMLGMFTDALPLCFSMEDLTCKPRSLRMSAVLHPCSGCGCETCLSLVLDAKSALCVEGAVIDVVELP